MDKFSCTVPGVGAKKIRCATSALMDIPPGEVLARYGLVRLDIRQLKEKLAAMKANRIRVTNLPETSVRGLVLVQNGYPHHFFRQFCCVSPGKIAKTRNHHSTLDYTAETDFRETRDGVKY